MFFNNFGQFNFGFFNNGFNNMFFPQTFFFNHFTPFQMPMFNFMPTFQAFSLYPSIWNTPPSWNVNSFSWNLNTPSWNSSVPNNTDTFTRTSSPPDGYDSIKGNSLVNIAKSRTVGDVGYCAKFVQEAISIAGLGACAGVDAYQMADTLRSNPNFKEISKDTDVNSLPAGCVLVYDKYSRNEDEAYGHTEFTTGDGRGVSDGISDSLSPNPSAIFMPV